MLVSMAHVGFPVGTNPKHVCLYRNPMGMRYMTLTLAVLIHSGIHIPSKRNSNMAYVIDHIGTVPDTRAV